MSQYTVEAILTATNKGFDKTFDRAVTSLQNFSSKMNNSKGVMDKVFGNAGSFVKAGAVLKVANKGLQMLSSSMGAAVSRVDIMNKFPKMMEAWGYSTKDTDRAISKLSDGIDGLPTKLDDVVGTTQKLTLLNGDLSKSTDLAIALNNAFLASGSSAGDAARGLEQYSQMMAVGKVDMQSWKTLQETMPVGLQKTAEAFGFAGASAQKDLYAALQSGEVTFDEFGDKIIELNEGLNGFAELARINSKGIATSFKNIQTAVSKNLANMIDGIDKAMQAKGLGSIAENLDKVKRGVNSTFEVINPLVFSMVENINTLGPAIASGLGAFATLSYAVPILDAVGLGFDKLPRLSDLSNTAIKKLGGTASSAFEKMKPDNVIKGLENLQLKAYGVGKHFEKLPSFLQPAMGKVESLISTGAINITGRLGDVVNGVQASFSKLPKFAQNAMSGIGTVFQTGMSTGTQILSNSLSVLQGLVKVALSSIGPAAIAGVVLAGMGVLYQQFGNQLDGLINIAITKGPMIISSLAQGITSKIPELINQGTVLMTGLANAIAANLPAIVSAGIQIIGSLVEGVGSNLGQLVESAVKIIAVIVDSIVTGLPKLIQIGMDLLLSLAKGIVQNLPLMVQSASDTVAKFAESIGTHLPQIIQTGIQIIVTLIQGISQNLPQLLVVGVQAIQTLVGAISQNLPQLIQGGILIIMTLAQAILTNLPQIMQTGMEILLAVIEGILENLPMIMMAGLQLIVQLVTAIVQNLPQIVSAGWEVIKAFVTGVLEAIGGLFGAIKDSIVNFFSGVWDTLTGKSEEGAASVSNSMSQMATNTQQSSMEVGSSLNALTTDFSSAYSSGSSSMSSLESSILSYNSSMATDTANKMSAINGSITDNLNTGALQGTSAIQGLNVDSSSHLDKLSKNAAATSFDFDSSISSNFESAYSSGSSSVKSLESDVTSSFDGMGSNVESKMQSMDSSIQSSFDSISKNTDSSLKNIDKTTSETFKNIDKTVNETLKQIESTTQSALSAIENKLKASLNSISQSIRNNMNQINQAISSGMQRVNSTMTQGTARALASVNSFRGGFHSAGINLSQGLASGIYAGSSAAISAAANVASRALAAAKARLAIHSPSRVFRDEVGKQMSLGMAEGIKKSGRDVTKEMESLTKNLVRKAERFDFTNKFEDIIGFADDFSDRITHSLSGLDMTKEEVSTVNHKIDGSSVRQPADIKLNLGGREYKAFVEDLTDSQDVKTRLELAY